MTRLQRKIPDPLRNALTRVRRLPPAASARPPAPPPDTPGDLSGLILYGQA